MPRRRSTIPFPKTLWDMLRPRPAKGRTPRAAQQKPPPRARPRSSSAPAPGSMAVRYLELERRMLKRYGVRVRKWRTSMSGVAWQVTYQDGTVSRLLESPRPKGPIC